jgi:hypothetical protein
MEVYVLILINSAALKLPVAFLKDMAIVAAKLTTGARALSSLVAALYVHLP